MVFANATNVSNLTGLLAYNNQITEINGIPLFAPLLLLAIFSILFLASSYNFIRRFVFASFTTFVFASFMSFALGVVPVYYPFLLLVITLISGFFLYREVSRPNQ